jgi:hypothetical protein
VTASAVSLVRVLVQLHVETRFFRQIGVGEKTLPVAEVDDSRNRWLQMDDEPS